LVSQAQELVKYF